VRAFILVIIGTPGERVKTGSSPAPFQNHTNKRGTTNKRETAKVAEVYAKDAK
jgi:hypothetical protein